LAQAQAELEQLLIKKAAAQRDQQARDGAHKTEAGDLAALKRLAGSKDPKTAALARELLQQLAKNGGREITIEGAHLRISPDGKAHILELRAGSDKSRTADKPRDGDKRREGDKPKSAPFEFRIESDKPKTQSKPGVLEFRIEGNADKPKPKEAPKAKPEAGILQFQFDNGGKPLQFKLNSEKPAPGKPAAKPAEAKGVLMLGEMRLQASGPGPSTLRMSTDGKTAAVISGDGTVTVFDVATGKQVMRFPGKK
jgi:hypothetical protein